MGNEHKTHDVSGIERRINYLRNELYTYDKFLRNPASDADIAAHAKWAIDAEDCQKELEQLQYLMSLHDRLTRPTAMAAWQVTIIVVSVVLAFFVALTSLYVALAVH